MKLVNYMLKRFFSIFFGAIVFFVLILCLTDLLINIWSYISKSVPMEKVGIITLYYIPKAVWYSVPIAVLFSTSYMLSDFYARNELLAIFASGISLLRFTLPLLIVAIVMSFGLFLFEDNVVVPTYAKKMKMQSEVLEQEESLNNDHIVILTEQGNVIYKADFYDDNLKRLYSLFVLFRNPDKSFNALIYSDNAVWKDNKWVLNGYYEYKQVEDEIIKVPVEKSLMERLIEPPESFRNNSISVQEVSAKEAKLYIEQLERSGLPTSEEKSEYYKKFSFPFVVFLVVFLAIGLSGKTKKNVLIVSLFLCIISVVLFYVLQMITMLMAKFQVIPPIFGGWFPVVLFIFISIILLKYSKT